MYLRHIHSLRSLVWGMGYGNVGISDCATNPAPHTCRGLQDVLIEKYHWEEEEAATLAAFLTPMLAYFPPARSTAHECLQHPWLKI